MTSSDDFGGGEIWVIRRLSSSDGCWSCGYRFVVSCIVTFCWRTPMIKQSHSPTIKHPTNCCGVIPYKSHEFERRCLVSLVGVERRDGSMHPMDPSRKCWWWNPSPYISCGRLIWTGRWIRRLVHPGNPEATFRNWPQRRDINDHKCHGCASNIFQMTVATVPSGHWTVCYGFTTLHSVRCKKPGSQTCWKMFAKMACRKSATSGHTESGEISDMARSSAPIEAAPKLCVSSSRYRWCGRYQG